MGVCDWDRQKTESKLGGEGMHLVCCWVISLLQLFAADLMLFQGNSNGFQLYPQTGGHLLRAENSPHNLLLPEEGGKGFHG